jgi:hypothetical protein
MVEERNDVGFYSAEEVVEENLLLLALTSLKGKLAFTLVHIRFYEKVYFSHL